MAKPLSNHLPFTKSEQENQEGAPLPEVYHQLKKIAASYMRRERASHTLQPTALVHEALLQLGKKAESDFKDRIHFLASAAQMMRWILLDYAKARKREKRGGGKLLVTFDENLHSEPEGLDFLSLDTALKILEKENPRLAKVVELRFFGGLSVEEVGQVLNISPATVKRDWQLARAWLYRELTNGEGEAGGEGEAP